MAAARILIVEDEPQLRALLRLYLEREGYQVTDAGDGRSALAAFEAAGYKTFELTPDGPSEVRGNVRPLQNLFACPSEIFTTL